MTNIKNIIYNFIIKNIDYLYIIIMSKYVMLKSRNGFADRLQMLLNIMTYSIKTNRILVVDWNDEIWAGSTNFDFYYYFSFSNSIKWISYENFKKLFYKRMTGYSIFPEVWNKKNLFNKNVKNLTYFNVSFNEDNYTLLKENKEIIKIINNKRPDFLENIVVLYKNTYREYNIYMFKYISLKNIIKQKIASFEIIQKIKNIDYICVHLRGTDRRKKDNYTNNNSNNYTEYTKKLKNKLDNRVFKDIKNIVIISDTIFLIEEFQKILEKDYVIYISENILNKSFKNSTTGLHQLNNNMLTNIGKTKYDVNIYTLLDFCILLNSKEIICDNHSYFSNTARRINYITNEKLLDFKSI